MTIWTMRGPLAWRRAGLGLAVLLLALVPRLADLGRAPFWYDEVVTLQRAALPLPALVHDALIHHHLPTYFLLMVPLAGAADPQFWLRLPSALFGGVSVLLVYLIAARIGGRGAGLAAALIFGLAPTQIAFAQEARSYTLVICLILVALYGLVGLVLEREAAGCRDWVCFTVGGAGAAAVLGDSLPWLLVGNLVGALLVSRAHDRWWLLRRLLVADAAMLAVALPLYGAMLAVQTSSVANGLGWVPKPGLALLRYDVGVVYLMRIGDFVSFHFMAPLRPLGWVIGLGLVLAVAGAAWHLRRRPVLLATLLLSWLLLPVSFGLVSIWHPILMPRYILWSSAPFAVLAGIGADAATRRLGGGGRVLAFGVVAALLIVNLLPFYRVETKPRWDVAARLLAVESKPGDVFYFYEAGAAPTMRYYLPNNLQAVLIADWSGDRRHAVQAETRGHRVWAIYGDAWQTTSWQSRADFAASLAPLGTPARQWLVGSRITMWRYDPR